MNYLSKRNLKENTVLCGLWFGEEKPLYVEFFATTNSLKTIYSQGIEVTSPDIARTFISKGILLACHLIYQQRLFLI